LGLALKNLNTSRHNYVLSTKILFGCFPDDGNTIINSHSTNRKHIIEGVNRSLKNLDHDYIDVLFCHRYDDETPTQEVCEAMRDLISQGKILYWATSTWPNVRIMEAIHICDKIGAPRPIADQCIYNMLKRNDVEKEYTVLLDDYGYGTTTWSPLHMGILTGKYNNGIPEGSRFEKITHISSPIMQEFFGEGKKEKTLEMLNKLVEIAKKYDASIS